MFYNFDTNATYGLLPGVASKLSSYNNTLFNPSSIHSLGQNSRILIEESRERLRAFLGAEKSSRIIYTSGATEANNSAIFSPFTEYLKKYGPNERAKLTLITTSVEHPSVLEACKKLDEYGFDVVYLDVDKNGYLNFERLVETLNSKKVLLVSMMAANNETGHIFDLNKAFKIIKEISPDTLIHTDCVQLVGKKEFSIKDINADLFTLSGHKIGALSGVGALIAKDDSKLKPFIFGGPQEMHFRAGTENLLGIISFGLALEEVSLYLKNRIADLESRKNIFLNSLYNSKTDVSVEFGEGMGFLPNTLSLRFAGIIADDLVAALDINGVKVSSGAACASGKPDPSHVLLALGYTPKQAKEFIRVSLSADQELSDFKTGLDVFIKTIEEFSSKRQAA